MSMSSKKTKFAPSPIYNPLDQISNDPTNITLNTPSDSEKHAQALMAKAQPLVQAGNLHGAADIGFEILKLYPDYVPALIMMAQIQLNLARYDLALPCFRAIESLKPDHPKLYSHMGYAMVELDLYEEGIPCLEKAIEINNDPFAHYALGNAYARLGKKDLSQKHLKIAHEEEPDDILFLERYLADGSCIKSEDDPLIQKLLEMASNIKTIPRDKQSRVYSCLNTVYNKLGQYEKAFDFAIKAGKAKQFELRVILHAPPPTMQSVEAFFTKDLLEKLAPEGHPSDQMVFVLGMPRSGTTLLEQILEAHPDCYGMGEEESLIRGTFDYAYIDTPEGCDTPFPLRAQANEGVYVPPYALGEKHCEYLQQKDITAKRVINKAIGNILMAGYFHLVFPNAKFIHIKRNAMDSCVSCFQTNFRGFSQPYSYNLKTLGQYYHDYEGLMAHWNESFPANTILNINYEDIVEDIESTARKVVSHIGLEWDDRCLNFYKNKSVVRTASLDQVRKPIYKSAMGKWKRYGEKTLPLIKALGDSAPPEAIAYMNEIKGR